MSSETSGAGGTNGVWCGLRVVVMLLVALPVFADTLGDLKAAVSRLTAKQPVRGTYVLESAINTQGRFANEKTARQVAIEVVHDATGVTITIPQALIEKASHDASQRSIGSIRSMEVVEAIDFRDSLLDMLNLGTVTGEKRVMFHGKPARLLALSLAQAPRRNSITIGSVKITTDMNVWIGDDNLPIAAEKVQKTKAGFMMIHADTTRKTSYTFARSGDRLILTRMETSGSASGLGQKFDESSVQTMTVH